jgi:heptosyltransferase-2
VQNEVFDVVVNLEKVSGICAMADNIKAWKRYGFRFNPITGNADYYMFSEKAMEIVTNESAKKTHGMTWQERLFEMLGAEWKGEEHILGYQPSSIEQYDVGFNYRVGGKWPTKAWSMDNWKRLEGLCRKNGISVSWQEGMDNLYDYIDWINKCRVVVSNDSLGLHMAITLKKKVIGLFGTTSEKEVCFYSQGTPITPDGDLSCRPCYSPTCIYPVECINTITPETVLQHIKAICQAIYQAI